MLWRSNISNFFRNFQQRFNHIASLNGNADYPHFASVLRSAAVEPRLQSDCPAGRLARLDSERATLCTCTTEQRSYSTLLQRFQVCAISPARKRNNIYPSFASPEWTRSPSPSFLSNAYCEETHNRRALVWLQIHSLENIQGRLSSFFFLHTLCSHTSCL